MDDRTRTVTTPGRRAWRAEEAGVGLSLRLLGSGRLVRIRTELVIGSGREAGLRIRDRHVSRRHCVVRRRFGQAWLEDLGSRNGTWVDGVAVDRCRLLPGCRVVVGDACIEVVGPPDGRASWGELVGSHPAMDEVRRLVARFGRTRAPVLVQGETGTGKELVARALHRASPCAGGPFEALNCGAIPRELAESELFGHVRGAFTGAARDRPGAFERADGGTLLLDELGELPLGLQPKLLRVLEGGELRRVGDGETRRVRVRVVSATNRDLLAEARAGRFRLDLYHRLAVGVIHLPPLRARASDIPLLVAHFLRVLPEATPEARLGPGVMAHLMAQPWPGNVRALQATLRRGLMLGGPLVTLDDLAPPEPPAPAAPHEGWVRYAGRPFADVRREIYARVLRRHGGNRSAAAAALGIPKSTLWEQLRAMGIP